MGDRSLAESDRCMGDRSLAESASAVRLLVGAMPATSRCSQRNAHLVAMVTGYQRAFATQGDLQHLLPGAKHAFPQQPPPCPWHGKLSPLTFSQQTSCSPTQAPPQHLSPPAHSNLVPSWFQHCTGGLRRREDEFCALRTAKSEFSSPPHSPATEHSASPRATAALPKRRARVTMGAYAMMLCKNCTTRW